jgi:hypothetical protein
VEVGWRPNDQISFTQLGPVPAPKNLKIRNLDDQLATLGRGGMAIICKAEDIRLDRFVALKFLLDDSPNPPA